MNYTLFETFVGAGGSHIGFKKHGYVSKYVNVFSHDAMETLLINNPEIKETEYVDESSIIDVDDTLVRKIILNVSVYDDHFVICFKSGIEMGV